MNPKPPKTGANLLIVDDAPINLELLARMLKQQGFTVRLAPNGELALKAAQHEPPDLILLDINMPGMNGYEVCERLKADRALKAIPVIFISALDAMLDKVKAFGVGGVDYICKPFEFGEVEARVRTHVALRRQERQLEENLAQLKELERLRDSLVHMIVHDMRSPLAALLMAVELAEQEPRPDPEVLARLLRTVGTAAQTLNEMTVQLLDISRLEDGKMPIKKEHRDLTDTVRKTMESLVAVAQKKRLSLDAPTSAVAAYDEALIKRVVGNLITNAVKFSPPEGRIQLTVGREGECARVEVTDTGRGIAPEYHHKIFEKFGQVEMRDKLVGTGLGLTFCRLAVEAHGGQIGVKSQVGKGSSFWFTLPGATTEG